MQDSSLYFYVTEKQRRLTRGYDWLIMLLIYLFLCFHVRNFVIVNRIVPLCGVGFFYLLIYCPLMDALFGGTIGRYLSGIKVVQDYDINHKISIWQSYKRSIIASWPMILFLIVKLMAHYGINSAEFPAEDPETGDVVGNTTIIDELSGIIAFIGLLWYFSSQIQKNGQTLYDKRANTILIEKKNKEDRYIS